MQVRSPAPLEISLSFNADPTKPLAPVIATFFKECILKHHNSKIIETREKARRRAMIIPKRLENHCTKELY
jgi:hypothetical protein